MSEPHTPSPEHAEPLPAFEASKAMIERQQRLDEALRTVKFISGLAGREIPIESVSDPFDIPHTPGVYVLKENSETDAPIADTSFALKKTLLSGVADSAHAVIAGDMGIDYKDGASKIIEVAAKCYAKRSPEERYVRAIREVTVTRAMAEAGEIAVEPIAIAIAPADGPTNGEVILFTKYDRSLLTLDNLEWGRGLDDEENIVGALAAARALGEFEAMGFRHGDSKIKNFATNGGEKVGLIDFETTIRIDTNDPIAVGETAYVDFGLLLDSLVKKGFMQADGTWATSQIVGQMVDVYLEAWTDASPEVQMRLVDQITETVSPFKAKTLVSA